MRKWVCVFLLVCLICAANAALSEVTGIEIQSPHNGDVLNLSDDMVLFSFIVPEGKEEDTYTYILKDTGANEILDLDEIMVDSEDKIGLIGFDTSMFEKGGSYSIRITGNEDTTLDAAVDFKISSIATPTDTEADPDGTEERIQAAPQDGYALTMISPEDGEVIETAENPEIQFLWILDEYPVEDIPYTWKIETADGESLLNGSGRMNSSRKQYGFAVPSSMFAAGSKYTFRIESMDEESAAAFSLAKAPEPTATPKATATPEPSVTPTPVPTPTPTPKKTQEELIASAAAKLGVPSSYISKVRMSGDTAYPFAAELEGGTIAGDATLRIESPSNGAVMSYHSDIFFEVKLEALQSVKDRLVIQFTDVQGDNILYIMYYEKPIEAGKTASLAVPCRYFAPDTLIRLSIESVESEKINSMTLFSFRGFTPTPAPVSTPAPTATPAPTKAPEPTTQIVAEPASTPEPTTQIAATSEPEKIEAAELSGKSQPALTVQIEEIEGRVKIHREGTINVRALPDEKSQRIGIAKADGVYTCTGITENGWYRIVMRDGSQGYVSKKLSRLVWIKR